MIIPPPKDQREPAQRAELCDEATGQTFKFGEQDLQAFKYFDLLQPLLQQLHDVGTERDRAGNRKLLFDQYASLMLLYFFNPVITSLRGIKHASGFRKVQRELGVSRSSFGSLSEAGSVFDAELLQPIIEQLAGQLQPLHKGREAEALKNLTAVDGSLLPALPKMAWALWNYDDKKAARLHLHFEVLKAAPVKAKITHGKSCEKKALHEMLEAGRFYVMDRGYEQFRLFQAIVDLPSSFICCVRDQMTWEILHERPLSDEARAAGVEIQVYMALIASLLISLWVGRKPTKRTYETLCFYFLGIAELDEVMEHIANLKKND